MDFFKLRIGNVSIYLCRRNIFVAKQLLDGTQISAITKQISRKGMP